MMKGDSNCWTELLRSEPQTGIRLSRSSLPNYLRPFSNLVCSLYGDSEDLLGKWFKRTGKRDEVFLASKFGFVLHPGDTRHTIDSSGEYCKKACVTSMQKMGVDHLDLFYMHRANSDVPIEQTMRAMAELKA